MVVDDYSTDGTREVLQKLQGRSSLKVHFNQKNQGKGACLHTGFGMAAGEIIIIQDADLEYYPDEYPQMIELIASGKADVVYGSRFLGQHRAFKYTHYLKNRALTFLTNVLYNTTLTDMETCYKAFRRGVLDGMTLKAKRFGFEPEFTARVVQRKFRLYETPISYAGRSQAEGKKITWKAGIKALYWLLRCKFEHLDINRQTRARMALIPKYSRWLFQNIKPQLGQRVLELNAGAGDITQNLLGRELVVATDPDEENVHTLRSRFVQGPRVRIMRFDPAKPPSEVLRRMRFDTIICYNTLEKIEDDSGALRHFSDLLEPGGKLLLMVPAHKTLFGPMDKALGRLRRYRRAELAAKLAATGMEIETPRFYNAVGVFGWFINSTILRRKILPSLQLRLFNLFSRLFRAERVLAPPFGLTLMAVARKSGQAVLEPEKEQDKASGADRESRPGRDSGSSRRGGQSRQRQRTDRRPEPKPADRPERTDEPDREEETERPGREPGREPEREPEKVPQKAGPVRMVETLAREPEEDELPTDDTERGAESEAEPELPDNDDDDLNVYDPDE